MANVQSVAAQPVVGALSVLVALGVIALGDRTRSASCEVTQVDGNTTNTTNGLSAMCQALFIGNNSVSIQQVLCTSESAIAGAAAAAATACDEVDCLRWQAFVDKIVMSIAPMVLAGVFLYGCTYVWRTIKCGRLGRVPRTDAFAYPGSRAVQVAVLLRLRSRNNHMVWLKNARQNAVEHGGPVQYGGSFARSLR